MRAEKPREVEEDWVRSGGTAPDIRNRSGYFTSRHAYCKLQPGLDAATDYGEREMERLAGGLARRVVRRSNTAGKPAG